MRTTPNRRRANPTKHKAKPTVYVDREARGLVGRIADALSLTPQNCESKTGVPWSDVEDMYKLPRVRLPDYHGHPFFQVASRLIDEKLGLLIHVRDELAQKAAKDAQDATARRLSMERR